MEKEFCEAGEGKGWEKALGDQGEVAEVQPHERGSQGCWELEPGPLGAEPGAREDEVVHSHAVQNVEVFNLKYEREKKTNRNILCLLVGRLLTGVHPVNHICIFDGAVMYACDLSHA